MRFARFAIVLTGFFLALLAGEGLVGEQQAFAQTSKAVVKPATKAEFEASIELTKAAMMGDPQQALALARKAVALANRLPESPESRTARATALWLEGEALLGTNDRMAATPVIAAALSLVEQHARNTKLHGDLLRSRGAIESMGGNVVAALTDYQSAFAVYQAAKVPRGQAMVLQDIGQIYSEAGDFPKVLRYYGQAIEIYGNDPALSLTTHNNRADVYREQKKYDLALPEFKLALAAAKELDSPLLQVRILTNLAISETEAGRPAAARTALTQALTLSTNGEAAGWRPFVLGAQAKAAASEGDTNRALALLDQTFAGVDLASSDMLFRDYHLTASQVYEASGKTELALRHFKAYQRLDSEARSLTASIATQLTSAQFDFANQNLKIARLNEEKLKNDIAARTRLFLVLGSAAMVILGIMLFGLNSLRRSRNQVRAANDNLTVSNTSLEKALLAKTEFLAMTSHEIRTPLNGILGMTQVLLADRRVEADLRSRIEVVNSAGETMRALVDDILDVAKMESGELTIVEERTDLAAILKETSQLWSGQAEAKRLEIELETENAPRLILGDGGRIRQIVFNLMSNALKFTLAGKVLLRVAAETEAGGGEMLKIEVIDTGVGIPEDMLEVIFESFKQVDAGTTRQFSGTGLGLAICKRLAEAMGGTIFAQSTLNSGSTFTVLLPLTRFADETGVAGDSGTPIDLSDFALAAVLPNHDTAILLKMALLAEAKSLEFASGLTAAIALLGQSRIDQMVFDVACLDAGAADPVADLRGLVAACDDAGTKLSLMLAKEGPLVPAQAMLLGAAQIIIGPVALDQLLSALRSVHADQPEVFVAPTLMAATG